jgi:DNA-binding NtrC family response regulator
MRLLFITTGVADSQWIAVLERAVAPLGELNVIKMDDAMQQIHEEYGIVMVDATVVENVEEYVSRLRTENPESRIVVMTASPTWTRARAAYQAGAIDYLPKTLSEEELRRNFKEILLRPLPPWP